jgi:2-methylcitrate dehydratase PrpD
MDYSNEVVRRIRPDMPIAHDLAERILDFKYADLPEQAIRWSEIAFLDTVGVTLAGATEDCVQILERLPGAINADGPCLAFASGRRTDPMNAMLINGTASHALDFDDFAWGIGGHPSVPLVPAILAVGEMQNVSGEDAITAYVAGFETESRFGHALHPYHYNRGWHPTVTLGIFGTVAAAGRLLGLDKDQLATALAIAASMASGVKANFGTMVKPLHVGHCLRDGMMAVMIAKDGFTARDVAFEHKQGYFQVFNGEGNFDAAKLFENWADPLEIVSPAFGLKQFPCCGSTHTAINCLMELSSEHGLTPDNVVKIDVLANPNRLPHTDNPDPQTGLGGKFSLQYLLARTLTDQRINLSSFEDAAIQETAVRDLMPMVSMGAHPDMAYDGDNQFGAEVTVTKKTGETVNRRIDHRLGRGPDHPMSRDEMWDKFADCAGRVLSPDRILEVFEQLNTFRQLSQISAVTEAIEGAWTREAAVAE